MLLKKVYEECTIKDNYMTLDTENYGVKKGKHAIWVPLLSGKIVWSFQGKITPFNDWEKGSDVESISSKKYYEGDGFEKESLQSIVNEYKIFELMASKGYSPKVNGIFYIKCVTSDFLKNEMYTDTKGVYGIYIDDAYKYNERGNYVFGEIEPNDRGYYDTETLPDRFENEISSLLEMSDGAKGDMKKRDNIVNGYIIDIRRTLWDMMKLKDLPEDTYKEIEYITESTNE